MALEPAGKNQNRPGKKSRKVAVSRNLISVDGKEVKVRGRVNFIYPGQPYICKVVQGKQN